MIKLKNFKNFLVQVNNNQKVFKNKILFKYKMTNKRV